MKLFSLMTGGSICSCQQCAGAFSGGISQPGLWDFITDYTTQEIYRKFVQKVRADQIT